ncbi:LytR/AlgR family response regulator transcription factor [Portibacter lacus]|uniref:DNA-binding response regulator n=1 Tax=Portibacter lacus TaxID=1099794 RepID=A0AA37SN90_9BACT|nr:LytTR family DNA-binding domain-containing protein [Portibacter lacus]GLR16832.1 DNA-binding response regulator [Portibacter lacus]
MTRYIIIDDEPIAHDIIKGYGDMLPEMQLVQNCYDAIEALSYLNEHQVDLIFLDLNMPKLKGFAFLKTLSNPPKVIVTTAYKEFALEGYELNIVDYLLKPFSFERFLKAVHKAIKTSDKQEVRSIISNDNSPESIFLQSNKKYFQVDIRTILFLESAGNYVKVVTTEETITIRDKISALLEKLPASQFIKVHKSFAVAKSHIQSIEGNRIFIADHEVPIGKMYRTEIKALLR